MVNYTSNEPLNQRGAERERRENGLNGTFSESSAIYLQIASMIENDVLRGILCEGEQVPSTNELARAYNINPATAAKGINLLVDEGVLYKRRGIGMFVAEGARTAIVQKRKNAFYDAFVTQLVREAKALNISKEELTAMIERAASE